MLRKPAYSCLPNVMCNQPDKTLTTALTYGQICELEDSLDHSDRLYSQIKSTWLAMTDWPTPIADTNDLLKILGGQISGKLTKQNLITYLDSLNQNIGLSGNGWKAETITSLIDLFTFHPQANTLAEIFGHLKQEVSIKM